VIGWPAKPEKPGQPKVLGMTVDELTQLVASLEAENEELREVCQEAYAYMQGVPIAPLSAAGNLYERLRKVSVKP